MIVFYLYDTVTRVRFYITLFKYTVETFSDLPVMGGKNEISVAK